MTPRVCKKCGAYDHVTSRHSVAAANARKFRKRCARNPVVLVKKVQVSELFSREEMLMFLIGAYDRAADFEMVRRSDVFRPLVASGRKQSLDYYDNMRYRNV